MTKEPPPQQTNTRAVRVAGMAGAFVVTMLVAPSILRAIAGPPNKWSGSVGIVLFILPGVAAVLWVLFSVIAAAMFVTRDRSSMSVAGCIGIGFVLALIGTFVTLSLYHIPAYGPGP